MRVLVIAEAANPEWVSVPLVGWSIYKGLKAVVDVHLITHIRNKEAILKTGLLEGKDFTVVNSEAIARPLWKLGKLLRGGEGKGWTTTTAINTFSYYYFEYLVWKGFKKDIKSGQYDIVHRVTPLSPTVPSLIAKKCSSANVPFVIGPLNGGVPWPKEFDSARRQENEWLSYIRDIYKLMPGYKSTLKYSDAIITGSKYTLSKIPIKYAGKTFYIPENAINPEFFNLSLENNYKKLYACFVGRLVPYKGPDILLEAALPLLKLNLLHIDIVGDGPLMALLTEMVIKNGVENNVTFHGWVAHSEIQKIMIRSQVMAFPSIREFGGGVVLEAMALGIVPLIVDYAGPGELVDNETGYKVSLGTRENIIHDLREKLDFIVKNKSVLNKKGKAAKEKVMRLFTWGAKSQQIAEIYDWVLKKKIDKPSFFD